MKDAFNNKVPAPYKNVETIETEKGCEISLWGRTYKIDNNLLFSSITSQGEELLASPIRIKAGENGHDVIWRDIDVIVGETTDQHAYVYTTAQSDAFIVNISTKVEFDGLATLDVKLMPKGYTVPQLFGLESKESTPTLLDYFHIEVPIKDDIAKLYHVSPNKVHPDDEGNTGNMDKYSSSAYLSDKNADLDFASILYVGNDDKGLFTYCESNELWQPVEKEKSYQFVDGGDHTVVRMRLLDSQPYAWQDVDAKFGQYKYPAICYRIAFQASPVKAFPSNPYKEKLLHIDCFKKIQGDYIDFLANPVVEGDTEIGYDRIKRLGVTTLVLHEKWNNIQNYWKLTKRTERQLTTIIEECHKRGIKVVPYFGYEVSTMAEIFADNKDEVALLRKGEETRSVQWYRFPAQREIPVCYCSSIADKFVDGLEALVDKYNFDGVYLDGTAMTRACQNRAHGCGYIDREGNLQPTYRMYPIRDMFKRLYEVFSSRGKIINCHISDCVNCGVLSFCDSLWMGEYIQYNLVKEGINDMPDGYLRASHSGRNFGIPTEFIVYENRPIWNFEDALVFAMLHGILPRPNDIGYPLEFMSGVWKIIDKFDLDGAQFVPYHNNPYFVSDNENIKISAFKKDGKWLLFVANADGYDQGEVTINGFDGKKIFCESCGKELKAENGKLTLSFNRFAHYFITVE